MRNFADKKHLIAAGDSNNLQMAKLLRFFSILSFMNDGDYRIDFCNGMHVIHFNTCSYINLAKKRILKTYTIQGQTHYEARQKSIYFILLRLEFIQNELVTAINMNSMFSTFDWEFFDECVTRANFIYDNQLIHNSIF